MNSSNFTIVAIPTKVAELVRTTKRAPGYALGCGLVSAGAVTCLLWDSSYFEFVVVGWVAIIVCGSLAVWIAGRFAGVEPG